MLYDPEAEEFEKAYLHVKVEHKNSEDTYYLKKILLSEQTVLSDGNGHKYFDISIPQWMNGSGSPANDKYTGQEQRIVVSLVKGDDASTDVNILYITGKQIISQTMQISPRRGRITLN